MIKHLRDAEKTSTIALWGRSMGAATALLHGEREREGGAGGGECFIQCLAMHAAAVAMASNCR